MATHTGASAGTMTAEDTATGTVVIMVTVATVTVATVTVATVTVATVTVVTVTSAEAMTIVAIKAMTAGTLSLNPGSREAP